jgi:biotin carboxyl carrier protein
MLYQLNIGTQDYIVEVNEQKAGTLRVSVNGTAYDVIVRQAAASASQTLPAGLVRPPTTNIGPPAMATGSAPLPPAGDGAVLAPIPGLILEIKVRVGDIVQAGQAVAVMEAMKMENNLNANLSGEVKEILVQKGSEVATGDVILRIG